MRSFLGGMGLRVMHPLAEAPLQSGGQGDGGIAILVAQTIRLGVE